MRSSVIVSSRTLDNAAATSTRRTARHAAAIAVNAPMKSAWVDVNSAITHSANRSTYRRSVLVRVALCRGLRPRQVSSNTTDTNAPASAVVGAHVLAVTIRASMVAPAANDGAPSHKTTLLVCVYVAFRTQSGKS